MKVLQQWHITHGQRNISEHLMWRFYNQLQTVGTVCYQDSRFKGICMWNNQTHLIASSQHFVVKHMTSEFWYKIQEKYHNFNYQFLSTLQGCHNDGISNHWHLDCYLNCLLRHRSKKTSKLRIIGLRDRNSPVTGEFPTQTCSISNEHGKSYKCYVNGLLQDCGNCSANVLQLPQSCT